MLLGLLLLFLLPTLLKLGTVFLVEALALPRCGDLTWLVQVLLVCSVVLLLAPPHLFANPVECPQDLGMSFVCHSVG